MLRSSISHQGLIDYDNKIGVIEAIEIRKRGALFDNVEILLY